MTHVDFAAQTISCCTSELGLVSSVVTGDGGLVVPPPPTTIVPIDPKDDSDDSSTGLDWNELNAFYLSSAVYAIMLIFITVSFLLGRKNLDVKASLQNIPSQSEVVSSEKRHVRLDSAFDKTHLEQQFQEMESG
jgi:hypothetical protein